MAETTVELKLLTGSIWYKNKQKSVFLYINTSRGGICRIIKVKVIFLHTLFANLFDIVSKYMYDLKMPKSLF